MKKSFLLIAALALTLVACNKKEEVEDKTVATFEEAAISPAQAESEFLYTSDTVAFLKSGNFELQESVTFGGSMVAGAVISNHTATDKSGYAGAYYSVAGGAHEGANYAVWYCNAWGDADVIKLAQAAVVPGMYVCNNMYAYSSMKEGDDYAGGPFEEGDYFTLTITGSLNGTAVNAKVDFDLARGTNIVADWTYVDLSQLGQVDELHFALTGSRTGDYGLNTPAYFCIDDLGAKK